MIDLDVARVEAVLGKAVIELEDREEITASGLIVIEHRSGKDYRPNRDYEIGVVTSIGRTQTVTGDSEWWPMEIGSRVIVQARSGGEAGADIGMALGMARGKVIVVEMDEVVAVYEKG